MKKVLFNLLLFFSIACNIHAQKMDSLKVVKLDAVVVSATRTSQNAPVAVSNLNEEEIKKENAAKNIPALLQTLPSVVSYTEGGTFVGNTSFRIRGTDANRINITLNGMPLNNPESQEVYWVNLPDLSNSLQSIQLQRGVGTSTNGTASFGGSISMQTTGSKSKPYADLSTAYGQYNSFLLSGSAGTGIMKNGLSIDGRYSQVKSDGYIRNGKVDHRNIYAAISHYTDKQLIRLIYMNGIQHTGITWEGIDPSKIDADRRYNPAGEYKDENGNIKYYDNETDNYYSNIGQLIYTRYLTNKLTLNSNISYNHGYGYYENYKVGRSFSTFGLPNQTVNSIIYKKSDIILRKQMKNSLSSASLNIAYNYDKVGITLGGAFNYFDGDHYGRLLWIKNNENIADGYEWYRNSATKQDANIFLKAEYRPLDNLAFFAEIQERYIDYRMRGLDDDLEDLANKNHYNFVNPKVGASYLFNDKNEIYASFGIANREPLRADLKESLKAGGTRNITSERLYNYELGYKFSSEIFAFSSNLYYMKYKNQLIQTGKLNDVGYKLQENVPNSYRTGIELALSYTPNYWLKLDGNATLSQNKIKDYTAYYTVYDPETYDPVIPQKQVTEFFKSTDISFSPSFTGSFIVNFKPFEKKDLNISFVNKYVGAMYYDNTSNPDNRLSDYFVTDMIASYTLNLENAGKLDFQFTVNNIANVKYSANAWVDTYVFSDGTKEIYKGLYPQAGTNVMGRIRYRF